MISTKIFMKHLISAFLGCLTAAGEVLRKLLWSVSISAVNAQRNKTSIKKLVDERFKKLPGSQHGFAQIMHVSNKKCNC